MTATARRAFRLLCCAAFLVGAGVAHATDPARALGQLHHGTLHAQDGAPADSPSMAQTEDGWLWFSSRMGLFRYDGFEFQKFPLLPASSNESEATWQLYAAPGGDLWVSRAYGGVARVRREAVTFYGTADGLPDRAAVNEFATDGDGRLWAATEAGYFRFDGTRWNDLSAKAPDGEFQQFLEDRRGDLWMVTDSGVFILRKGADGFVGAGEGFALTQQMMLHPDGSLWLRSRDGLRPAPGDWGTPHAFRRPLNTTSTTTLFDRGGTLWSVGCRQNLCRIPAPAIGRAVPVADNPAAQVATPDLGLTSLGTITTLEDRDGTVWVSTKAGFDTFRDSWLSVVRFPTFRVYFALFEQGDGTVWTGSAANTPYNDLLWHLDPDPSALEGFEGSVTATWQEKDGSVLLGGYGELWRKRPGLLPEERSLPPDAAQKKTLVHAIGRDGMGRLWISLRLRGLYVQRPDGAWLPASSIDGLPDVAPSVIHIDDRGRPWFGYQNGTVIMVDGTRLHRYGAAQHLEHGPVTSIATIDGRRVVGSEHGLSILDGDRFRTFAIEPAGRLDSITGIVRSRDGGVWAYGIAGALHFTPEAWSSAIAHPSQPVDAELLTMEDGVPGPAQLVRPLPTILAASDGKLWFAGSQGLAWVDPSRPHRRPDPPPVVIRSIASGTTTLLHNEAVVLEHGRDLQVSYTALAPGRPRGLMFRHMLEGLDREYMYAGAHREASYMDLPPGSYRFVAEASYDGRHWSRSVPLDVSVPARLFERPWFQLACVAVLALLVWMAHRWRVRWLTRRLRARLTERHQERERIARELHDTLLQGVQGLILRFQAFADGLSKDDHARSVLERTIDRAEALLVEGRDRVKGLRTQAAEYGSLEARVAGQAEELDIPAQVDVRVLRTPRLVNPAVIDELHSIVREAMVNAMRHSHARSIVVSVEYRRRWLTVTVSDDGDGFDTSPGLPSGDGHYGIVGMRERAARLGGRLDVTSTPKRGATVTARIPGRVAYARETPRT